MLKICVIVILGTIMSVLDTTVVNVALETLSRDLHSSLDDIQWVVTGYLLSLAAVIPVTGWASRRFGQRRLYLTSIVLFTVSSALCGLAWSTGSLVAFRVLQGVGGGMILPVGQMILARVAGPQRMGRIMSIIIVPVVLAPILGPTLGGLLIEHLSWRWIFYINVPIGALAVVLGLRVLPRDPAGREEAGRLDVIGLGLLAGGLVGITYGLAESGTSASVLAWNVVGPFVAGLALVGAFVLRALRIERPILDVRLYANRAFASASVTTFCVGAALFGALILLPLYLQTVRGESAVVTGMLLAPQGLGAGISIFLSGRAADRLGGGRIALAGVLVLAVGTVPFLFFGAHTPYWIIGGAIFIRGLGIGMAFVPAMTAAFAAMTPAQIPDATPQLNVLQRVGGSIGTAIFAVVLQSHIDAIVGPTTAAALAAAYASTYWWVLGVTLVAAIPACVLIRAEARARRLARSPRPATPQDVGPASA